MHCKFAPQYLPHMSAAAICNGQTRCIPTCYVFLSKRWQLFYSAIAIMHHSICFVYLLQPHVICQPLHSFLLHVPT